MLKKLKQHIVSILFGFLLTFIALWLIDPSSPYVKNSMERLEGIVYDQRLNITLPATPRKTDFNIFVVDIDEKSLKEVGRFPWPRTVVKDLVSQLVDAGVVVIGFDIAFSEPEINPVDQMQNAELGSALYDSNPEIFEQLKQDVDADNQLASVLGDTDVVLGILFQDDPLVDVGKLKPSTVSLLDSEVNFETLTRRHYVGQLSNVDVIQNAALGQGFFNSAPDPDGYIRRALTVVEHEGELYSSLSLEMARLYSLSDMIEIETEFIPAIEGHSITAVRFGQTRIPTDAYGRVLVPYRGGQKSFPYYSAADILNGRIDSHLLEGGLALIGTSAVGLSDLRATPVGLQYPGVEVHANVLEGILQAAKRSVSGEEEEVTELFSYRPDWWAQAVFFQVLILGFVLTFWLPLLGPIQMALVGLIGSVAVISFNFYLWQMQKIEMPLLQPLVLVMLITIFNMVRGFFKENSSRQQIKSMFDQYVPPAHIDQMLDDPDSVNLEGERREMTVLFSDIRSFTSISERLSANDLKDMLNEYFSPITKSIFEHQGTIDKYVGDMVMAFWGAPLQDPQHAEHAVIGGFDMLKITADLRSAFAAKGWPEIYVGIGINTGEMNVGDMGSEYRRAYTVLGDAVNLGSRLEGLTKFYGLEFLVSETTKSQCPNIEFRPIDRVKVKGKDQAVAIYEPICEKGSLTEQENEELSLLLEAYQAYLEQRWLDAEVLYRRLQEQNSTRKLYPIYLERIELLREQELPENWDGSFTHTSK